MSNSNIIFKKFDVSVLNTYQSGSSYYLEKPYLLSLETYLLFTPTNSLMTEFKLNLDTTKNFIAGRIILCMHINYISDLSKTKQLNIYFGLHTAGSLFSMAIDFTDALLQQK